MTSWKQITPSERDRLLGLYQSRMLKQATADKVGINLQTLGRRLREWRNLKETRLEESNIPTWMPDSPSQDWVDAIVIEEDDYIVISDIEIPDHDPAVLQAVLLLAMEKNIKTLIIAGDLLATDNQALNSWVDSWAVGNQINYEGALGIAVDILARYLNWFDNIYVIQGNHDDRIDRKTGGEVWFGMLLKASEIEVQRRNLDNKDSTAQITFSRYPYMYVKTSRGTMYICHQHNYSKTPVRLAQQIYETENGPDWDARDLNSVSENCHILITHTHIIQSGFSIDQSREMYGIGCCRDPYKTKYMRTSANKFPEWNQGFFYAKGAYFYQVPRRSTNWVELLGKHAPDAEIVGV